MKIDTAACRQFIADFHARNPQIEQTRFGDDLDEEGLALLADPANWKREHRLRPLSEAQGHDPMLRYRVYKDGEPVNERAEAQCSATGALIAWEHRLTCKPFEGQVAYLVLEDFFGRLLMGDYVGD